MKFAKQKNVLSSCESRATRRCSFIVFRVVYGNRVGSRQQMRAHLLHFVDEYAYTCKQRRKKFIWMQLCAKTSCNFQRMEKVIIYSIGISREKKIQPMAVALDARASRSKRYWMPCIKFHSNDQSRESYEFALSYKIVKEQRERIRGISRKAQHWARVRVWTLCDDSTTE